MAHTAAQRQALYRQRHLKDEHAKAERLNTLIDVHAKRALERLSACYGVTQRQMLTRVLIAAEGEALERAAELAHGQAGYYEKRLRLGDVTQ